MPIPRVKGGKFAKGVSGNPSGRPKIPGDVIALAKSHTASAINALAGIVRNPKANATARVLAANSLLDRAWGKAIQRSETRSFNVNLSQLSDAELLALLGPDGATLEALPAEIPEGDALN